MKSRIFLGSSADNLGVLNRVAGLLSDVGECILWTKAFVQNRSNLDSLMRQTKLSDFSIMLAMKNDLLLKKNEIHDVARDNVIFEFGLFLGSSGINRSYLLAEDGINLPSDLDGITISKFTLEEGKYNSIDKICQNIKEAIISISKGSDLGFLPSTALAIGYYYNFVSKVCEEIHTSGKVVTGDKENQREFIVKDFKFNVVIPESLDDNGIESFRALYNKKNKLNNATTGAITVAKRGFPFVFRLEPPEQDENGEITIELYDVPTTLNTIIEALRLYLPKEQVGQNDEVEHLETRELRNFAKVLTYLISRNTNTKNYVDVRDNSVV
jgi:hypothetical protein